MFTGIVQGIGSIRSVVEIAGDASLWIEVPPGFLADTVTGDSIAVSGVCLTVIDQEEGAFRADVSNETRSCTTAAHWSAGTAVNLEPALRAGDPLGGHLVSGHVDAIATIKKTQADARSQQLWFSRSRTLAGLVAPKGSVTIDGVSLTVNEVSEDSFSVNLVPHTLAVTTLGKRKTGDQVNLEIDVLARYVAAALNIDLGK